MKSKLVLFSLLLYGATLFPSCKKQTQSNNLDKQISMAVGDGNGDSLSPEDAAHLDSSVTQVSYSEFFNPDKAS